jgi:3-hydroxyisobutyrate dehydrogenase
MVNQIVIAGNMAGAVEGIMYASKSGLDMNKTLDIITQGAANSFSLEVLGRRVVNNNLDPGFYV